MDVLDFELKLARQRLANQQKQLESMNTILSKPDLDPVSASFFSNKRLRVERLMRETNTVIASLEGAIANASASSKQVDAFGKTKAK